MRRVKQAALTLTALFVGFVFLNNSALFAAPRGGRPTILAHRGLAQTFSTEGLTNDTCTAERIHPPTHDYLENTLRSMQAAFDLGADMIELDIHPTTDGQFAVFHDWTLECRTEGQGVTRSHSMAHLKTLDIGYGYTADAGTTFPFRGKGVGLMPTLDEVLAAFPGRLLLINIKSRDASEGAMLADRLARLPPEARDRLQVYGHEIPIGALRERLPDVRTLTARAIRDCLLAYGASGWTGYLPSACERSLVFLPVNVAPWLWGWPTVLLNRFERGGSRVFALGPYSGQGFSTRIDSEADLQRLPADYDGGIYTNELLFVVERVSRR